MVGASPVVASDATPGGIDLHPVLGEERDILHGSPLRRIPRRVEQDAVGQSEDGRLLVGKKRDSR